MADVDSSMYVFCKEITNATKKLFYLENAQMKFLEAILGFYREHLKNTDGFPWALSENLRESLIKPNILKEGEITEYIKEVKQDTLKNISHISCDTFENEFKED